VPSGKAWELISPFGNFILTIFAKNIDISGSNFYHTKSVDQSSPFFLLEEMMRKSSQKVPIPSL
jgi:hypothetical protein